MKLQDSVSTVAGAVKLPPSITLFLQNNKEECEDDGYINGGILKNSRFAWLSSSAKFIVINILTGHKIATWTFGAVLRDLRTRVTCVEELPTPLLEQSTQLLVGLECELMGGMVCLLHCQGSRVLRAVRVDCRVACLRYVPHCPRGALRCFDGIVLVGTHGGTTLAFDLSRQSCIEAILHANSGQEDLIRDELNIANLVVLSMDDIDLLHEQRAIACEKEDHIAIQVNEGCFHNLQYILHNPDNTVRLRATREKVFVTSLLYVPQLGSVFIAFNFGAFQLWNLITLQLEFTSLPNSDGLPISHFGFMEPCDDPRAFCYLWVVYSSLDRHEEGFPLAAMYALTYEGKTALSAGGYLYDKFITCNLRFNIELSSIETNNSTLKQVIGGRSLACHTITMSDCDDSVLSLCQIVWECWTVSAIAPVQSMMILFDIDQWYKEQMPDCTVLETNSYLSVVNLGDTLSHTASSYLCDVRINPDTLTPYYAVPRLEEHFYPNSLGYDCYCLTNTDVTRLSTMGVQRQILSSISEAGPSLLLQPAKLLQQCVACGLLPLYVEPTPAINSPILIQRQTILSIALEARLLPFLLSCSHAWATGSHSGAGLSLSFLTRWAWTRALRLKAGAGVLTLPLFDHSGGAPDGNSARLLDSCTRQLAALASLLGNISDKCLPLMTPEAVKEVKLQQKAVQVVALYFQVVQWFLNVGLLPEFPMERQPLMEDGVERLPYPVDSLVRYYQNRRYKLHCLNGENPAVENLQDKFCPLLFIDQFIKMECAEEKLKSFWMDDGSKTQGLYPPPSLHSLLRVYLIPEIKEEYKHYLVLYVLVDYATTFDESRYENIIRKLMQFPTMFGFSNTGLKITEAFWHLDHRDFDFALVQLQSLLAGGCLKQWQHNVVLSSLLAQKKTQSALQYLHVRNPCATIASDTTPTGEDKIIDDWQASCNLYLSRGLVLEAFNLIKESLSNFDTSDLKAQRLLIFLEGCRKAGLLSKVLPLSLSHDEEEILTKFLKALGDSESNNLLVMYYLQRSRYIEAQQVNEELQYLSGKGQLPYDVTSDFSMKRDHIPKTKNRQEIVDLYCKTLPKITRCLAQLATTNFMGRKMTMPTPMTVNLQAVIPKPAEYKSSIIQASINKANETWMDKPTVARGLKRALQVEDTPFICTPKMARHSSRLESVEMMNTTPDSKPSPSKRPRTASPSAEGPLGGEGMEPRLREEVEALLHTPTVERRRRWGRTSALSSPERSSVREATPQSILKVRKLLESGNSSVDERHFAETDDELETASQHTQSDNLSRSIRFNIPSVEHTPSVSPELNYNYDFKQNQYKSGNSFKISPRKGIHDTGTIDVEMSHTTPVKRTPPRGRKLISASNSSHSSLNNSVSEDSLFTPIKSRLSSQDFVSRIIEDGSRYSSKIDYDDEIEMVPNVSKGDTLIEDDVDISTRQETLCESGLRTAEESHGIKPEVSHSDEEDCDSETHEEVEVSTSVPISQIIQQTATGPKPRRSLRSTPDREISNLVQSPLATRNLRSRTRTPEPKLPINIKNSAAKSTPRPRRSLARMVMEANALSKSSDNRDVISIPKEDPTIISERLEISPTDDINRSSADVYEYSKSISSYNSISVSQNAETVFSQSYSHKSFLEKSTKGDNITVSQESSSQSIKTSVTPQTPESHNISVTDTHSSITDFKDDLTVAGKLLKLLCSPADDSLLASDVSDAESDVSYRVSEYVSIPEDIAEEPASADVQECIAISEVISPSNNPEERNVEPIVEEVVEEYVDSPNIQNSCDDIVEEINVNTELPPASPEEGMIIEKVEENAVPDINSDSNSANLVINLESEETDVLHTSFPSKVGNSLLQSDESDVAENESDEETNSKRSNEECEDKNIIEVASVHSDTQDEDIDENEEKNSSSSSESGDAEEESNESSGDEHEHDNDDENSESEQDEENSAADSESSSADNLYIEESSEDVVNKAVILNNDTDVISITSSEDSQTKSEAKMVSEIVPEEIVLQGELPVDDVKATEVPKNTEIVKIDDITDSKTNEETVTPVEVEDEKMETEHDLDPLEINTAHKTLTQEELNNMSLMTEDSYHDEATISLKYSEDESDSNQGKKTKNINNNMDDVATIDPPENIPVEQVDTSEQIKQSTIVESIKEKVQAEEIVPEEVKNDDEKHEDVKLEIEQEKMQFELPNNESIVKPEVFKSTPKRKPKRSSVSLSPVLKPDELNTSGSTTEDLDTSIAMSTRSASKRKSEQSKKTDSITGSLHRDSDDNASYVSNASSRRSRRSSTRLDTSFCAELPADEGGQLPPSRKFRRSVMTLVKPNLSIIPEVSHIENEKSQLDKTDVSKGIDSTSQLSSTSILEYSASRRLTRHQKSMLERSQDSTPRQIGRIVQRRSTVYSGDGIILEEDSESDNSEKEGHNVTSVRENLTGKTLDPIKLLDKEDFQGEPDMAEIHNMETASVSSMASSVALDFPTQERGQRSSSIASDVEARWTKQTSNDSARGPRASSVGTDFGNLSKRILSADAVASPLRSGTPTSMLDETITDSGGRPRRQSFNKAVEALSTPRRRRRPSSDSKNDDGASVSDTTSERGTPNIFKGNTISEGRLNDGNLSKSKLVVIEEDEVGEEKSEPSPPKIARRGRKAASIAGEMVTPDVNEEQRKKARRARMSQLLTPLSKEEQLNLEEARPRFRRRSSTSKMVQQLQFTVKKK